MRAADRRAQAGTGIAWLVAVVILMRLTLNDLTDGALGALAALAVMFGGGGVWWLRSGYRGALTKYEASASAEQSASVDDLAYEDALLKAERHLSS